MHVSESTSAWDVSDSSLLARFAGDRELVAELIGMFLEDCPAMLDIVRRGLADDNASAVSMGAHSLIGSAGNFDATAVVGRARTVEAHAVARDLPAARDAFVELEAETTHLLTRLTALRATL